MKDDLPDLAGALLAAAKRAGADAADALVVDGTSLSIDALNGTLEHAERSEGIDLGVRAILGGRQACVSSSDARPETIVTMAERAVAMAREAPEDPSIGLADPDALAPETGAAHLELADPGGDPDPETLKRAAIEAERAALEVAGVTQVQSASAGYSRYRIHLATSNGFSAGYARTSHALSCVAITGSGTEMERDHYGESMTFRADLPSPQEIGRIAGERAVARAGARKPPTGRFPVVFDERVSSGLIGHLLSAINGAAIARGSSWARDLLGKQVLPRGLSIVEEPDRVRGARSRPFDGEGLAARRSAIVEDGVLMRWVLDLASARKLGLETTANAARSTSAPPSPAVGNIVLSPGKASRAQLLRDMGQGLIVTSLIGSSINPTTGDYSRGASGFWVDNGDIAYPVNECTIAGNLRDVLASLRPANDARASRSRIVPSVLVEGLTLAGK